MSHFIFYITVAITSCFDFLSLVALIFLVDMVLFIKQSDAEVFMYLQSFLFKQVTTSCFMLIYNILIAFFTEL